MGKEISGNRKNIGFFETSLSSPSRDGKYRFHAKPLRGPEGLKATACSSCLSLQIERLVDIWRQGARKPTVFSRWVRLVCFVFVQLVACYVVAQSSLAKAQMSCGVFFCPSAVFEGFDEKLFLETFDFGVEPFRFVSVVTR